MQTSYKKSAVDTIAYGTAIVLTSLVGLIQAPLLIKLLGTFEYGLWSQVNTTVSLIMPFAILGLTAAVVRFLAAEKDKTEIQKGFYSAALVVFFTSAVAASILLAFSRPIALNFFDGNVTVVRVTAAMVVVYSLQSVFIYFLRTFQKVKEYSGFVVIEACMLTSVMVLLVLNGYGIVTIVISALVVRCFILFILIFRVRSQIGIGRLSFSRIKEYLRFGLPMILDGVGFWLVNVSDRYVISYFLGVALVGTYALAYTAGGLLQIISGTLRFVLLATLSKLYDEGRMTEVKTHLSYTVKYVMAIGIPFVFGAAVLAEPVLTVFSTPEVAAENRFVFPLIALSFLLLAINQTLVYNLILAKKPQIMAFFWIASAILNLGLNVLMVPRLGIIGAAITTLIAFAMALIICAYFSFKEFKFNIDLLFLVKSLIASVVMSVVVWYMAPGGSLYTALTVLVGIVVYGTVLILIRGFSKTEYRFFKELLSRSKR